MKRDTQGTRLSRALCLFALVISSAELMAQVPASTPVPGLYRERMKGRSAVPKKVAEAIGRGLDWLAAHQDEDGRWDVDGFMKHDPKRDKCSGPGNPVHDVGITGIVLLAFLADGHSTKVGAHRKTVAKGIEWLLDQQAGGAGSGLIGTNRSHDFIYDHLFATYAVLEAYGFARSSRLRDASAAAVQVIKHHRNPAAVWRYQPRDKDNDTSVTVLATLVLHAAQEMGVDKTPEHLAIVGKYLDVVTEPSTGHAGYTKRGEMSGRHPGDHSTRFPVHYGRAMTAAAAIGRFMIGQRCESGSALDKAADHMLGARPTWNPGKGTIDLYYWMYASLAMRQVGGRRWKTWSKDLYAALLKGQKKTKGSVSGSWPPLSVWSVDGGRLYSTAMAVLCLETSYRYALFAELTPIPEGVPGLGSVEARWRKGDFAGVERAVKVLLKKSDTLSAQQKTVLADVKVQLEARDEQALARVESLRAGPDFLASRETLKRIKKKFGTLSAGRRATFVLAEFRRNKTTRYEINAMLALRKAQSKGPLEIPAPRPRSLPERAPWNPKHKVIAPRYRARLVKLVAKFPGTLAAKKAAKLIK